MDRKFLEGLDLEKEAIDTILNKNGEEVSALKTKLSTRGGCDARFQNGG